MAKTTTAEAKAEKKQKAFSERIKISHETLKLVFNRDTPPAHNSKLKKFIDTLNARIKDGKIRALRDYRAWAAVDLAFKNPFTQINPMIIASILDTAVKADDVKKQLEMWGLSEETLFVDGLAPDGVTPCKFLNKDTFYKILLPTVMTYCEAREAKLYNDRDQFPLLKYEPFTSTTQNTLVSEALTAIFEKQGHQLGDRSTLKQVIKNGIKYGTVLAFPMEAWYSEKSTLENGDEYCVKEGLRYQIPHPTRMFWDQSHRPSSFNTDSGCDYAGYWRIMRWGDVESNSLYWNTKKVEYGKLDWGHTYHHYFQEVYPCQMKFPVMPTGNDSSREASQTMYSNTSDNDKAVMVTDFFWKLIPKNWGLGDYEYPVWFRFVVASDDTVIFAEPLPYPPVLYMGLDIDENQARNASFALKIVPFGVHMGNILSQIVLSLKSNATKVVVYDSKQLDEAQIRNLKNVSNDVSKTHYIPWDSTKSRNAQLDPGKMLFTLDLPQQPIAEQTNTLNVFISVMERMLGISPQEVGAAGVHVQTAEESRILSSNSTQRVDFSGTHVDDWMDAFKKQKYLAAMAFMDEEFIAQVSGNAEYLPILEQLGWELLQENKDYYVVKGKKSKLTMEAFTSVREGKNRSNNPQIAQVMMQTVQAIAGNEFLAQSIGPEQIIDKLNRATKLAGGPRDNDFVPQTQQQNGGQQAAAQMQQMQEQMQQLQQENQQLQEQIETDQIKAQADLQKAQLKSQTDLEIANSRNQTAIEVAHVAASVKIGDAAHKSHADALANEQKNKVELAKTAAQLKHDAKQAELDRKTQVKIASKRATPKKK